MITTQEHSFTLIPFAHAPGALSGAVQLTQDRLNIFYSLTGLSDLIEMPKPSDQAEFKDNLWRETCMEIFIAELHSSKYVEFNFSSTGDYAYYCFDDYRRRSAETVCFPAPAITALHAATRGIWQVHVAVNISPIHMFLTNLASGPLVNLATTIKFKNGDTHFWALAHPESKPDFHDRKGFILGLQPTT